MSIELILALIAVLGFGALAVVKLSKKQPKPVEVKKEPVVQPKRATKKKVSKKK